MMESKLGKREPYTHQPDTDFLRPFIVQYAVMWILLGGKEFSLFVALYDSVKWYRMSWNMPKWSIANAE